MRIYRETLLALLVFYQATLIPSSLAENDQSKVSDGPEDIQAMVLRNLKTAFPNIDWEKIHQLLSGGDLSKVPIEIRSLFTNRINVLFLGELMHLSEDCAESIYYMGHEIFKLYSTGGQAETWPLKMLDATAKIPNGIMDLNLQQLGGYDQCISIDHHMTDEEKHNFPMQGGRIQGSHCTIAVPISENLPLLGPMISATESASQKVIQNVESLIAQTLVRFELNDEKKKWNGIEEFATFLKQEINKTEAPFSASQSKLAMILSQASTIITPLFGVCLPKKCVPYVNLALAKVKEARKVTLHNYGCHPRDDAQLNESGTAIAAILIAIATLMVIGTIIDYWIRSLQDSILKTEAQSSYFLQLFTAFSVYSNSKRLFDIRSNPKNINCLNGFRVLSILFVICGHTYMMSATLPVSNIMDVPDYLTSFPLQMIFNAVTWVDSFFLMSGLLLTYLGLRDFEKVKKSVQGMKPQLRIFHYTQAILVFYLHRWIRLTPAMMLVVALATLWSQLGDGPRWYLFEPWVLQNCKEYWWTNMLYVGNLIENSGQIEYKCYGETWYLMCDFQFYIIAPFILITFVYKKFYGLVLNFIILIVSIITTAIVVAQNNYPPTTIVGVTDSTGPYYEDVYTKPWTRIGPFCIGIFYGYLLRNHRASIKIPRIINLILWLVSLTIIATITFMTKHWYDGHAWTTTQATAFNSLSRTAWGICWGYIILSCATGRGGVVNSILSWPGFQPFAKLSYMAYLMHWMLIWYYSSRYRTTFYWDTYNVFQLYAGTLVTVFAASYIAHLAFEAPFGQIDRLIFDSKQKTAKKPQISGREAINGDAPVCPMESANRTNAVKSA